jgi:hypothetical protein
MQETGMARGLNFWSGGAHMEATDRVRALGRAVRMKWLTGPRRGDQSWAQAQFSTLFFSFFWFFFSFLFSNS